MKLIAYGDNFAPVSKTLVRLCVARRDIEQERFALLLAKNETTIGKVDKIIDELIDRYRKLFV